VDDRPPPHRRAAALALVPLGVLLAAGAAVLAAHARPETAASTGEFLRQVDEDGGRRMHLELGLHELVPADGRGPRVFLAAAIHIADRRYYDELQRFLDAQDLVLFESVKPAGTGPPAFDLGEPDDAARARTTEGRIRYLATMLHRYHADEGVWPGSLDELIEGLGRDHARLAAVSRLDGWGRELRYARSPAGATGPPFALASLGADGARGGTGPDADLSFAQQPPLEDRERGEGAGIQARLAEAMGLVFQLDAMSHDRPNWENSDLSIDQVEARLAGSGTESEELFGLLGGSSLMARVGEVMLGMIGRSEKASAMLRIAGLELLSRTEAILSSVPGEMGELLRVLIEERNRVVVADLEAALASRPDLESVAVVYGAAHMPDLEQRILGTLAYERGERRWLRAVTVDVDALGLPEEAVKTLRSLVRSTLDSQLGQLDASR